MIGLTGSRFQHINCLDCPQSSLQNTQTMVTLNSLQMCNDSKWPWCDFYCFYSTITTVLSSDWMTGGRNAQRHDKPNVNNAVICVLSSDFLIKFCPTARNIAMSHWGWLICCVKWNKMFGNFSLICSLQQMSGSCGFVWKLWFSLNSTSLSYLSSLSLGLLEDVLLFCCTAR